MDEKYYYPLSLHLLCRRGGKEFQPFFDVPVGFTELANRILRPMFNKAGEAYVYNGAAPRETSFGSIIEPLKLNNIDILVPDKGKYKFNLAKDCFTDYEELWTVDSWHRGFIVVVLPLDFDFSEILPFCGRPNLNGTPNMGESPAAIKKCKAEVVNGNIAISFSASNGIQWMQLYAIVAKRDEIYSLAKRLCVEPNYYPDD